MKSNQLVSIIMTCHNGEKFLNEAIKSIINQSYSNWELIFYDNKSNDRSANIIKNFKDQRIKYFRSEKLLNLGTIRRLSFNQCKGFFITFLDTDDYWVEFKLEKQVKKFQENDKIDVLYSNYFTNVNQKIEKKTKHLFKGYCQSKIIESYINGSPLTAWLTLMIKKNSIEKLEYSFDNKTHISSDFDLIIRLSNFSNFDYLDDYLAYYRVHEDNESKNTKEEINELIYILNKFSINKKLQKIFGYKNYLFKIYIKYFIQKKYENDLNKNFYLVNNIKIKIIYLIVKILPKSILKFIIK